VSIIQDALKKARKESLKKNNKVPKETSTYVIHSEEPSLFLMIKEMLPWKYVIAGTSVFILIAFTYLFFGRSTPESVPKIIEEARKRQIEIKTNLAKQESARIRPLKPKEDIVDAIKRSFYGKSNDLALKGIMYSQSEPLAVINDSIMKEGDEAWNMRIVKIRPTSVDVEKAGDLITLKLKP